MLQEDVKDGGILPRQVLSCSVLPCTMSSSTLLSTIGSWWTWATTNWLSTWWFELLLFSLLYDSSLDAVLAVETVENLGFCEDVAQITLEDGFIVVWQFMIIASVSPKTYFWDIYVIMKLYICMKYNILYV